MLDGTLDTLYMADIPAAPGPILTLRWPWPIAARRVGILGGDPALAGTLLVEAGGE
jgi:hypothetical protein